MERGSESEDQSLGIEVRRATESELPAIRRFYVEYLAHNSVLGLEIPPTESNITTLWETMILPAWRSGDPVLVAMVNGKLAGAIYWSKNFLDQNRSAFGHGTYVLPEFRRHGVATALSLAASEQLRREGVVRVVGTVLKSNESGLGRVQRLIDEGRAAVLGYQVELKL